MCYWYLSVEGSEANEGRHWPKTEYTDRSIDRYLRDQEKAAALREVVVSAEAQEEKLWELISLDQVLENTALPPLILL